MQLVFCVDGLRCSYQLLTELVAQVNVDFVETAFVVAESGKVLIDVLPLAVLLVCIQGCLRSIHRLYEGEERNPG